MTTYGQGKQHIFIIINGSDKNSGIVTSIVIAKRLQGVDI